MVIPMPTADPICQGHEAPRRTDIPARIGVDEAKRTSGFRRWRQNKSLVAHSGI